MSVSHKESIQKTNKQTKNFYCSPPGLKHYTLYSKHYTSPKQFNALKKNKNQCNQCFGFLISYDAEKGRSIRGGGEEGGKIGGVKEVFH